MAQQGSDELQRLSREMVGLVNRFDAVRDSNGLSHRAELEDIFSILGKSIKDEQIIPKLSEDKEKELRELLPKINDMLQQCTAPPAQPKQQQQQQQQPAKTKKKMPSVSDCNPFKSRSSSSPSHDQGKQQGDHDQDADALSALSAKLKAVLKEVEYYEWTTSYVDEDRIYGWAEEAGMVVDALVGPRPPDDQADKKDDAPAADANNKGASKVEKTEAPAEDEELLFRAAGIAGIHGSGKTALAQKVFVHGRIKDAFPLRLWVCVGPPDNEDRFNLLYRMLDNLGLDTEKVEKIVDNSEAVKTSVDKDKSKIGVLLFILYVTLCKTRYLIVFDDIRASYKDGSKDGWYSNLTLQPPKNGEWFDRLAYGLPKVNKSAVLVTCRNEDDARIMVRTGSVFRPPELGVEDGWKLFKREYEAANKRIEGSSYVIEEDKRYKELNEIKMQETIVGKCLGLPVAIIEAAKGFAKRKSLHDDKLPVETGTSKSEPAAAQAEAPQDDQPA